MDSIETLRNLCYRYSANQFAHEYYIKLRTDKTFSTMKNPIYRKLFIKFSQIGQDLDTHTTIIMKRYVLSIKILENPSSINDPDVYETLLILSPSRIWKDRIRNFSIINEGILNFTLMIEDLAWQTMLELIIHPVYHEYLRVIDSNPEFIKENLRQIYYEL